MSFVVIFLFAARAPFFESSIAGDGIRIRYDVLIDLDEYLTIKQAEDRIYKVHAR